MAVSRRTAIGRGPWPAGVRFGRLPVLLGLVAGLWALPGVAGAQEAGGAWQPGPEARGPATFDGFIDAPAPYAPVPGDAAIEVRGWVADAAAASGTGIDEVHLYLDTAGPGGRFLGKAVPGEPRPDVAASRGHPAWAASGFRLVVPVHALPLGYQSLTLYAHSPERGWWARQVVVDVIADGLPSPGDRALLALRALDGHFPVGPELLREGIPYLPGDNPYAYNWPLVRAWAARLDVAGMPGVGPEPLAAAQRQLVGLERYWDSQGSPPGYASYVLPPLGGGGDKFYDDNAWAGLAHVQQHRLTGDATSLARARLVFELLATGWDDDPSHPAPGGVFWVQADWSRGRSVVSTAPSAELALHLHALTGDAGYLAWAERMYDWTRRTLRAPNALYWDGIGLDGAIDPAQWSYNQGTMIGAGVLLHRATGDPVYLEDARRTANAALEVYGRGYGYAEQPLAFNAIFFRNLLLLEVETGDGRYRRALQAYTDEVWRTARDPNTGLFHTGPPGPFTLLDQAAAIQLHALLAWQPPAYGRLS